MTIPTPGQLYADLDATGKATFDRQLARYTSDPNSYDNPWESIEDYADQSTDAATPKKLVPELDPETGRREETKVKSKLSISSTSTLNPEEPRTLSAGYDPENFIMTVQFRDGTLWNYYDVPPEMWEAFSDADSKGRYLKGSGLDDWHNMGPASGSNTSWFKSRAARASSQQKEYGGMQIGRTRT